MGGCAAEGRERGEAPAVLGEGDDRVDVVRLVGDCGLLVVGDVVVLLKLVRRAA